MLLTWGMGGGLWGGSSGPSFVLGFKDNGSGAVDTSVQGSSAAATFTRAAATATTIGPTGLVLSAIGTNVPRSYYDPTSLAYLGYLPEGARTNLHTQSEDSTNAAWTKVDTTPTISGTAPDGAATGNIETEGSAGTALLSQAVTGTSNANYAVTRFLKRGNTDWVRITILNGANLVNGWFNLNTGVVGSTAVGGTGAAVAIRIKAFPSGWYRCELVGSVGSAATAITAGTSSASDDASTTRVNNATYAWWGAGFEDNVSFASTYIPTVGATVTRNADVLSYPIGSVSGTQGTVLVAYSNTNTDANKYYVSVSASASRAAFRLTSTDLIMNDGANIALGISPNTTGALTKAATAWSGATAVGAQSGVIGSTSPAVFDGDLNVDTTLGIGYLVSSGTGQPYGPISRVAYWPRRIPDSGLQSLTT